ncbi:MAG: sugar ABC transporter substrate-binding protein [Acetivibrionales bacterium]
MVLALIVSLFTGCGGAATSTDSSTTSGDTAADTAKADAAKTDAADDTSGKASTQGMMFAIFIAQNSNEFTMSVGNGAVKRGKELGIDVTVFDGKYDQATQTNQIETCIAQGYDGLIIEPCTVNGLDPVIKEAKNAGIPVITVIQQISNQDLVSSFVGADHYEAAKVQMQACIDAIGGKGNILICEGTAGSDGHNIIAKGFNEILAKYPDVKVLERQDCGWVIDKAIATTETWLQKHSDIDAILGENGDMALGAIKACQDSGKKTGPGGIYVSGRDAVSDELAFVKAGIENATIWQGGPDMGATAVDVILKLIKGESVEKEYIMPNIVVDTNNVDKYIQLKKELSAGQ